MRKFLSVLMLISLALVLTGCMEVYVKAPAGSNIEIAPDGDGVMYKEKRIFYTAYGIIPITGNDTADLMQGLPDGTKVSVKKHMTLLDYIISGIGTSILGSWTGGLLGIYTQTVSVYLVE